MKRFLTLLVGIGALTVLMTACAAQEAEPSPIPTPSQAIPTVNIPQPTDVQLHSTNGSELAPACPNVIASCTPPQARDTLPEDTFCVSKIPYQMVLVEEGITFEVLDPDTLTCVDNGVIIDGKHALECTGTQLWTTEVRLTNVACGSNTLQTNTDRCQEGYGYDASQNCCSPVTSEAGNSVTIMVNMGACGDGVQP